MPQSEDKLALDALNKEIETVIDKVINLEIILAESKAKLSNLQYQKKSMENILSMQQTIVNNIVNSIQKQQDELIKKRLNRILGYDLNLEDECKRRFPRIGIFNQDTETSYYWNDGSIDGIRIITFIQNPIDFSNLENNKLTTSISYK